MKAWLRYHHYALRETLLRVRHQPLSWFMNVLVVSMVLTLPLAAWIVLQNLQPLTGRLSSTPEISVFMQLDATHVDLGTIQQKLRATPQVADVTLITRQAALAAMNNHPELDLRDVLAVLPSNPLPDAFVVRAKESAGQPWESSMSASLPTLEALAAQFRQWPKVAHVQVDSAWIQRLNRLLRLLHLISFTLGIALATTIVVVIFNTTRLQAMAQRDEIEIETLFGATRSFIRRPFLYMGALQGLCGGGLALLLVGITLIPLGTSLNQFVQLYLSDFQFNPLPWRIVLMGLGTTVCLSCLGALLSVNRHLADLKK